MKFILIAFAFIGIAAAAILPDSATQGPNPQDIATPEPEYIDIDEPEPAPVATPKAAPKSAPANQLFSTAPRFNQQPASTFYSTPVEHYIQPQYSQELPGHYQTDSGYQYRRPVYIRRFYRRRY